MRSSEVPQTPLLMSLYPAVELAVAGKADEAVSLCRSVANEQLSYFDALCNTGMACIQTRHLDSAEILFRAALAVDARSYVANAQLGFVLISLGKHEESIPVLDMALQAKPDSHECLVNIGQALVCVGRLDDALPYLERALDNQPGCVATLCSIADILMALGRPAEAIAHYETALIYSPKEIDALNNLGIAFHHLGRTEEASRCFSKLVDILSPSSQEDEFCSTLNNLAVTLGELGRHSEAISHLERAYRIQPANLAVIGSLSAALNGQQRYGETVRLCESALNNGDVLPEAHNNFANALKALGRYDDALLHYRIAVERSPDASKIWVNLGSAALHIGRIPEAETAYGQAVKLDPVQGGSHRLFSAVHHYKEDDEHLLMMEQLMETPDQFTESQVMEIHFALGKAYDDVGKYAKAFHHFKNGNSLKRASIHYDEAAALALFDGMEQKMTKEFLAAFSHRGDVSASPVFIIGMPRSGTTMVEQILASVPGVMALGERPDFQECVDAAGLFPHLEPQKLGSAYLSSVARDAPDALRTVDKMMSNFLYVGLIHLALPNARIINVRRNPIDVCLSCYSLLFTGEQAFSYDLAELGRYYGRYDSLMRHWRSIVPETVFMDVDYESVVSDFETQARRIVSFCGLPWTDDCLSFHKVQRPILTASAMQVRQQLYGSSVGRWLPYKSFLAPLLEALEASVKGFH